MGGVGRRRAQRSLDHGRNLIIVDRARPARTRPVQQAFDTILEKTPAPFANRVLVHAEFGRNGFAREAVGTSQNDPASLRQRAGHAMSPNLPFQIRSFLRTQHQRRDRTSSLPALAIIALRQKFRALL